MLRCWNYATYIYNDNMNIIVAKILRFRIENIVCDTE